MSLGESMVVAAFVVKVVVTDLAKLSRVLLRLIRWSGRNVYASVQRLCKGET